MKPAAYETATVESDQQVIRRIRQGDESALMHVYRTNIVMVRKFILDNSGREEDADDMLQDALVVLWENVTHGDFDLTSKISTYVYSVVRNKWLREISKRKIGKTSNVDDHVVTEERIDVLKEIVHREEYQIILKCINDLGSTCRKVLTMFYLEEKGMEEIAREMKFANTDVAKAKKWQCKKELENLVKKAMNEKHGK